MKSKKPGSKSKPVAKFIEYKSLSPLLNELYTCPTLEYKSPQAVFVMSFNNPFTFIPFTALYEPKIGLISDLRLNLQKSAPRYELFYRSNHN